MGDEGFAEANVDEGDDAPVFEKCEWEASLSLMCIRTSESLQQEFRVEGRLPDDECSYSREGDQSFVDGTSGVGYRKKSDACESIGEQQRHPGHPGLVDSAHNLGCFPIACHEQHRAGRHIERRVSSTDDRYDDDGVDQ